MSINGIHSQSPSTLHDILLKLSDSDLTNYCSINTDAKNLYEDDAYWFIKLDQHFSCTSSDNKLLIPSQYVKKYSEPDIPGIITYKRWIKFKQLDFSKSPLTDSLLEDNIDILMLDLSSRKTTNTFQNMKLMNFAIKNGRSDIVKDSN